MARRLGRFPDFCFLCTSLKSVCDTQDSIELSEQLTVCSNLRFLDLVTGPVLLLLTSLSTFLLYRFDLDSSSSASRLRRFFGASCCTILGEFESEEDDNELRYSLTLSSPKSNALGCAGDAEVVAFVAELGGRSSCPDGLDDVVDDTELEVVDAEDETELDVDRLCNFLRCASLAPSTSRSRKPSDLSMEHELVFISTVMTSMEVLDSANHG